jgi:hypothetical protein
MFMIGIGPYTSFPRRRAIGMLMAMLGIFGATHARADAADSAIETAMMVGQIQALAEICSPPASSYQPVVTSAPRALQSAYRHAGLDPGAVMADISEGKQDETQRHDDLAWPLRCDQFPAQVKAVQARLTASGNQ